MSETDHSNETHETAKEANRSSAEEAAKLLSQPAVAAGLEAAAGENASIERQEQNTPEVIGKQPEIAFADIGGQENAKRQMETLALGFSDPQRYEKWGLKPPNGTLIHGPSGNGRSMLAEALASEAGAVYYEISPTDIASTHYGEVDARVDAIFAEAAENERAVIYLNRIDDIIPDLADTATVTHNFNKSILRNMDNVHSHEHVRVVASANNATSLNPALLQSDRLDNFVEVTPPDELGRQEIFDVHMARASKLAERELFSKDIMSDELACREKNLNGEDIAGIIRRTLEEKIWQEGGNGAEPSPVTMQEIIGELEKLQQSRPPEPTPPSSAAEAPPIPQRGRAGFIK